MIPRDIRSASFEKETPFPMAQTEPTTYPSGQVRCSYHPNVVTGLRCSRCGRPICPQCAVRTPVGLRCPDCAGVRGLPTYRTPTAALGRAIGAGVLVAIGTALLWRFFPQWQFYLCLLLGFGVVEAMARIVRDKRGPDLQAAALLIVAGGLILSRVLIAQRFGVTAADVNAMEDRILTPEVFETYGPFASVADVLQLRLIPDFLYAAIALLIAWVRFR